MGNCLVSRVILVSPLRGNARMPKKVGGDDRLHDLYADENVEIPPGAVRAVRTGLTMAIPEGYYLEIRPRSGLSLNELLVVTGTLDPDYRGEIKIIVCNLSHTQTFSVKSGDRLAQVALQKLRPIHFRHARHLPLSRFEHYGFGSTGLR